jgi:hypothetical protein
MLSSEKGRHTFRESRWTSLSPLRNFISGSSIAVPIIDAADHRCSKQTFVSPGLPLGGATVHRCDNQRILMPGFSR